MEKYMHNPELAQKQVLDLIDNAYGEDVVVTNATNPFNMLLDQRRQLSPSMTLI